MAFTALQLRVLRKFANVLQHSGPEVLKALDVLFAEMAVEAEKS